MKTFEIGDVVQLKSGGPKMTVMTKKDCGGHDTAGCVWFSNELVWSKCDFRTAALRLVASKNTKRTR